MRGVNGVAKLITERHDGVLPVRREFQSPETVSRQNVQGDANEFALKSNARCSGFGCGRFGCLWDRIGVGRADCLVQRELDLENEDHVDQGPADSGSEFASVDDLYLEGPRATCRAAY
ncbi:hypothetical protein FN846DRAFT_889926 [Sphaerosporella brunnea]|uniref:Uncharacterized protein n=1 Tax=Sphaerosporella brunnea TaxID=1250544 RepID=A0A5J5EXL8_9PEZI|nr:hypothetical protein FN846DRAFT_889926 [Sphaerosporella brunnea]